MNTRQKLEQLQEILGELAEQNESVPIIVEGVMDEKALRALDIGGKILRLHSGKSILNFCEELSREYDEVIILTDWDKRGKKYFKSLKKFLTSNEVKYIDHFWLNLKKRFGKEIQYVEELATYISHLREKNNNVSI